MIPRQGLATKITAGIEQARICFCTVTVTLVCVVPGARLITRSRDERRLSLTAHPNQDRASLPSTFLAFPNFQLLLVSGLQSMVH